MGWKKEKKEKRKVCEEKRGRMEGTLMHLKGIVLERERMEKKKKPKQ